MVANSIRVLRAKVLLPLGPPMLWIRVRIGGYSASSTGSCRFYGPADFLEVCAGALCKLGASDRDLYKAVLSQRLRVWYEPRGTVVFHRHFGVSDAYFAWREDGVIACLLYAYFEARLAHGARVWMTALKDYGILQERIHCAVGEWLSRHGYPAELRACFEATA